MVHRQNLIVRGVGITACCEAAGTGQRLQVAKLRRAVTCALHHHVSAQPRRATVICRIIDVAAAAPVARVFHHRWPC